MRYGEVIEEIKRLLIENAIPHFVCDDCASIVIADSKELLSRDGKGFGLDKNDPRFMGISQDIINDLKNKHRELHSIPGDENARKRQMELVKYGEALETILELAGKYNAGGLTSHKLGERNG